MLTASNCGPQHQIRGELLTCLVHLEQSVLLRECPQELRGLGRRHPGNRSGRLAGRAPGKQQTQGDGSAARCVVRLLCKRAAWFRGRGWPSETQASEVE